MFGPQFAWYSCIAGITVLKLRTNRSCRAPVSYKLHCISDISVLNNCNNVLEIVSTWLFMWFQEREEAEALLGIVGQKLKDENEELDSELAPARSGRSQTSKSRSKDMERVSSVRDELWTYLNFWHMIYPDIWSLYEHLIVTSAASLKLYVSEGIVFFIYTV